MKVIGGTVVLSPRPPPSLVIPRSTLSLLTFQKIHNI